MARQYLEPRERLALFYGPDEVRRRMADYSRKGREHDERYEREHGERPELFDQEFLIDLGARMSELEVCQDLAKLTDPQAAHTASRLISLCGAPQESRASGEPERKPQAKAPPPPIAPVSMHERNPMHAARTTDSDTSGFFENPNAIPLAPERNLKPVNDAGQFLSIFDEMRARQRAEKEARGREAAERQARSVAQLAQRQRDEALEMARGTVARFAATLGNIQPTLPPGTREDLMVRTLIATLDALMNAPPDDSPNVLRLPRAPRAGSTRRNAAKEQP